SGRSRTVSPDGRWRLSIDASTQPRTLRITTASGVPKIGWKDYGASGWLFWRPDGAGLVQFTMQPYGIITYHMNDPIPTRTPLHIPDLSRGLEVTPEACTNKDELIVAT